MPVRAENSELRSIRKASLREAMNEDRGRHSRQPRGCRQVERTSNLDDLDIYAEDAELTEE